MMEQLVAAAAHLLHVAWWRPRVLRLVKEQDRNGRLGCSLLPKVAHLLEVYGLLCLVLLDLLGCGLKASLWLNLHLVKKALVASLVLIRLHHLKIELIKKSNYYLIYNSTT